MFKIFSNLIQNTKINTIHMERFIGRWGIPNRPKYFETAILIMDRSNEDHCGIYSNDNVSNKYDNYSHNLNDEEIYYYPYTM